jgi:glycosyltransferase involved in cell wall biosynthesis
VRVLFVTHNVPRFDGDVAGSFVLRLAVALQTHGVRVEVLAPGAPGLAATGTLHGVTIHRVRYAADAQMTLAYDGTMVEQVRATWGGKLALAGLLRALRRAARAQVTNAITAGDPFDVVHTHWWFPAGLALWRALPRRSRDGRAGAGAPARVLTMHGSDVRLAEQVGPAHALFRAVLDEQTLSTAVSSWLANTARTMAPGREIRVEPMPVDARRFVLPETAADVRTGILFVGRLNAQKGIADLIAAMGHPALQHASLQIVGEGPDRDALNRQAEANGSASRLTWSGNLAPNELLGCYQRARVVAMPSRNEGLGLVAVESQLCGTPVVAYDSGGVVDVVRADAGGTLVPVGDIAQLAHALSEPLAHPELVEQRGSAARASMLAHFSTDAVGRRYLALYHDAVRAHRDGTHG